MDLSSNASTSNSREMSTGNQFPFDQLPHELVYCIADQLSDVPNSGIHMPSSSNLLNSNFPTDGRRKTLEGDGEGEGLGAMKEMIYKIAATQPVDIDPAIIRKPKRRNVRISDDPQSVAARHRRERISQKIRILQRLVPGGTKMDTASVLDEAIRYVKFLKRQVQELQSTLPSLPVGPFGHLSIADWPIRERSRSCLLHLHGTSVRTWF